MSITYCEAHDRHYDTDYFVTCRLCEEDNMHTPGPWKCTESVDLDNRIRDAKGYWICDVGYSHNNSDAENAEFIVRACNSHATLLEALERLRNAEKDCLALRNWDEGFKDWADVAELKDAQSTADNAIANARDA